ncbi:MAG: glycosyltransferase family 4 protein [Oscillospiraceae bacterium]|jgi:glycosyltransferase involved in cell wall biosynthesis|nr:glycosyltransferase family 4 protein [Oscillospiraceae bacterium]
MRIAMMTNNYKPYIGGVPISVERLSSGLRELGHTVYIFAPEYPGGGEDEDPYIIRYGSFAHTLSGNLQIPNCFDPKIEDIFRILDVDMIHVHHPMMIGQAALHLGRKHHIPVAFTYHTRYEMYLHYLKLYARLQNRVERSRNPLFASACGGVLRVAQEEIVPGFIRHFANQCSLVIAPSRSMAFHLRNQGVETPVEVMPTGLPESAYAPDEERAAEIRERFLGGKKHLLCTISRLAEEKNLPFLLQGLARLKERVGDSFRMLFLGDGPLRIPLTAQAEAMGLGDSVRFLGSIPNEEIVNYCGACDGFLFASKSETQGIVLLEAMAAGCPVVAVKASGTGDVVVSGRNGFLTGEDVEEWSYCAARLLEDEALGAELRLGAVRTAREYGTGCIAMQAQRHYESMIQRYQYSAGPSWRRALGLHMNQY